MLECVHRRAARYAGRPLAFVLSLLVLGAYPLSAATTTAGRAAVELTPRLLGRMGEIQGWTSVPKRSPPWCCSFVCVCVYDNRDSYLAQVFYFVGAIYRGVTYGVGTSHDSNLSPIPRLPNDTRSQTLARFNSCEAIRLSAQQLTVLPNQVRRCDRYRLL